MEKRRRAESTSVRGARETAKREVRSQPLEAEVDRLIDRQRTARPEVVEEKKYFETPDKLVMFYKYSHGGQSRFFRELKENSRLLGARCPKCRTVYFPPRAACGECYAPTRWREVSREGEVVSSTTCWYVTSEFFASVPYAIAYVRPLDADTAILQRLDLGGR
ncbi:protein containing DUF35, partial [mine drainage metagenome]